MMTTKPVALQVVVADNRMIGNTDDSPLPFDFDVGYAWMDHLESGVVDANKPSDTLKHSVIYGRRVYEEFLPLGLLPAGGGINVVVSSSLANPDGTPKPLPSVAGDETSVNPRLVAVGSIEQAVEIATQPEETDPKPGEMCLVLGGQRIYTDTLPKATFLRKLCMRTDFDGGVLFPEYSEADWTPIYKSKPKAQINKVDGKEVELQVVEYIRSKDANDPALKPVVESVKAVNKAFDQFEPLEQQ